MAEKNKIDALLASKVRVVNIGLREFATDLKSSGSEVIHIEWSPPAVSDPRIVALLVKMGM